MRGIVLKGGSESSGEKGEASGRRQKETQRKHNACFWDTYNCRGDDLLL